VGITIDNIHRETGLIVVEKIGIPDQGIELTIEDVEALSKFVELNKEKLAHASDFQE
jgi:predicted nucleic acid-binding protein